MLKVSSPRARKDGGTFWTQLGVAFENTGDKGKHTHVIYLDSLPLPDEDGRVAIFLFPTGEKEEGKKKKKKSPVNDDDEIPF